LLFSEYSRTKKEKVNAEKVMILLMFLGFRICLANIGNFQVLGYRELAKG